MIKANELRIGNLLRNFYSNEIISILPNDILAIYQIEISKNYQQFLNPIPFTEEWLLKFGFKNEGIFSHKIYLPNLPSDFLDGSICFSNDYNKIYILNGIFYYEIYFDSVDMGDNISCKEIKYVHQLQNLYFALEDKELTIKK